MNFNHYTNRTIDGHSIERHDNCLEFTVEDKYMRSLIICWPPTVDTNTRHPHQQEINEYEPKM